MRRSTSNVVYETRTVPAVPISQSAAPVAPLASYTKREVSSVATLEALADLVQTMSVRHAQVITLSSVICLASLAVAVNARAVGSAELYSGTSYQYGRFEARVRFAAGDGVVSSFFLWKDGSEKSGTFWNELDFEKVGADCHLETNVFFGSPAVPHARKQPIDVDLCADFHTYAYEWTPEYIAWFVDGAELRRETGATATAFAENASAGMQIRFNIWPGDASFGGNFSPAILPVKQYIDWVQYSSYADGAFKVDWRDDFDASSLSSTWLTGSWASPKNLSTHLPANVALVEGAAVLSLTADAGTGTGGGGGGTATTGSAPSSGDGCSVRPARSGSTPGGWLSLALIVGAALARRRRPGQ
jgi:MYXO-CTERM domain-containing protein